MTIKVGCRQCQSSYAVRDELAGVAVKCPKCKSPMKVPGQKKNLAENNPLTTANKSGGAALATSRKFNPLLDLLDEAGVEAKKQGRTCPMCAAEMSPTAVICVTCGFNAATGERLETMVLMDEDDLVKHQSEAEKLLAKAEKEIDDMPVSSFGQDFGEGKESYLIATVALICLVVFVALGVGAILFMDTIIKTFGISPEFISLLAAIGLTMLCTAYITFTAFRASPGHGIACLATGGIYCVIFGFMQGKGLLAATIMLLVSVFVGLISAVFLAYGIGKDALDVDKSPVNSMLWDAIELGRAASELAMMCW